MPTMTRPTTSGPVNVAPHDTPTTKLETEANWEYRLFCFMVICIVLLWSMMTLEFFGSTVWSIFEMSK